MANTMLRKIMNGLAVVNMFFAGLFLYRYIITSDYGFLAMMMFNAFVAGLVWESNYES